MFVIWFGDVSVNPYGYPMFPAWVWQTISGPKHAKATKGPHVQPNPHFVGFNMFQPLHRLCKCRSKLHRPDPSARHVTSSLPIQGLIQVVDGNLVRLNVRALKKYRLGFQTFSNCMLGCATFVLLNMMLHSWCWYLHVMLVIYGQIIHQWNT